MIPNHDSCYSRRILNFPAVQPCEGISPATLLRDLITLSRHICDYQSKTFAIHKRNAREAIRQIGILLIFFEEIRDRRGSVQPDSVLLCFSELHLTLQKLRFLLEDCSREGARLWILTKSQRISNEFCVLIRTVATALDVLPLRSIDVLAEVRELVELVAKQAQKAKFEVDANDERAEKNVHAILNQFENRIAPNPVDLRWVLDHLQIRSWNQCNEEIKFLDEEIELESTNGHAREVVLLSSLMGFMSYCRGVLFDVVDGRGTDPSDSRCNGEVLCLNPEDFRCPISLELMTDPVTISTGQTYDRSSIVRWFKGGNFTCPKTSEKLTNTELISNAALRKLIRQFCSDNGIAITESSSRNRDITRTISAGSLAAMGAMKLLAGYLAGVLAVGTGKERSKAAYEIRLFAKSSIFNRSCLVEAGTIPSLLNLLSSTDPITQENAIAALLNLSKYSKSKMVIVENRGLELTLKVLRKGLKMGARQMAAATLFYLSSVEEYRNLIGEIPEAIPSLVELIRDGTARGKKNGVVAIFGLLSPTNHRRVLAAGAVPLLVDLLTSSEREDLITDSLAVLAGLAEKPDGSIAILNTSALPIIMGILYSSTSRVGKEYCVSVLHSLCINGKAKTIAILEKNPSLMASLYSLLTEGTLRASKKANSLLNILHEFHNPSSSSLFAPPVPGERFLRVR